MQTSFLANIDAPDVSAAGITKSIINFLETNEIPRESFYSLSSDGASVMTGRISGVGVRLRDGWTEEGEGGLEPLDDIDNQNQIQVDYPPTAPYLIHIHCVAHR